MRGGRWLLLGALLGVQEVESEMSVGTEPLERSYLSVLACPDDRQFLARAQRMRALREMGAANRARLVTSCPPAVRERLIQKVSVSLRDPPTGESPGHEPFK